MQSMQMRAQARAVPTKAARGVPSLARAPLRRATVAKASAAVAPATLSQEQVDRCVNAIRFLAIDAVNKAKSGHPGLPMGCAPMAYVLFNEAMKYNPKDPKWFNRCVRRGRERERGREGGRKRERKPLCLLAASILLLLLLCSSSVCAPPPPLAAMRPPPLPAPRPLAPSVSAHPIGTLTQASMREEASQTRLSLSLSLSISLHQTKKTHSDRFVLSAGHGSMLQYALLHLCGYDSVSVSARAFATGSLLDAWTSTSRSGEGAREWCFVAFPTPNPPIAH